MERSRCENRNCLVIAVAASVIIGITTAILTFIATITVGTAFLWVVFGIAVAFLAVLLIAVGTRALRAFCCARNALSALLIGILGTILLSLVLLAIEFAATSVLGAIITGALLAFFSLIITASACIISCNEEYCHD